MILRNITFVNKITLFPGGLLVVAAEGGYAQKFKMAEPSDNPCSSSSEDNEYSDPLEIAASAGATLSAPEKSQYLSEKNQIFMIWVERDSVLQY